MGKGGICVRWRSRLGVWDAVFRRRQMRDFGREGRELRNSSPLFLRRGGSEGDIRMQNAALEAEGEGANQGHQPERASGNPARTTFPGTLARGRP